MKAANCWQNYSIFSRWISSSNRWSASDLSVFWR